VFDERGGKKTRLSELFSDGKDSLIIYSFMSGPEMKAPCPSCTSILDGLDGQSIHVTQMANFAVVAKSPIDRIMQFAKGRGWRNLRLLSSAGNSYNHDYQGGRHVDMVWPLWNLLDYTPSGRGGKWNPKLTYEGEKLPKN
jgi:predicted dithiol-disulfide oxidoreductase (DUF899 family)